MKKLLISFALLLGVASFAGAAQTGGGAYVAWMPSSGVVFNDGGTLLGVQCSTPGASAVNLNQYFIQFIDSSTTAGTGLLANGGVDVANLSTMTVTPPMILVSSSTTGGANGAMYLGADWSNWGGLHIKNDLFFFMSSRFLATGCAVYWRRERDY